MSPLRMAAITSGSSPSSGCRRGWVTGVHGRVAQLARSRAGPATSNRSLRSSSPSTAKTSSSSTPSASVSCARIERSIPAPTSTRTTSPKRRARSSSSTARSRSSASSETVKSASRVTRKTSCVDDLHAREELVEVLGDQVLERDAACGRRRQRHEARQHLLRDLHAREGLRAGDGVAHDHAQREREVRDVGEGAPEPDRQRRQHGEDLARKRSSSSARWAASTSSQVTMRMPCSASAGRRSSCTQRICRASLDAHGAADGGDRLRGRAPVLQGRLEAGLDLVVQAGHAHHEELVEVVRVDRAELQALEQRDARVLGELEHALVELEPGELAVEVEGVILEVGRRGSLDGLRGGLFDVGHLGVLRSCRRADEIPLPWPRRPVPPPGARWYPARARPAPAVSPARGPRRGSRRPPARRSPRASTRARPPGAGRRRAGAGPDPVRGGGGGPAVREAAARLDVLDRGAEGVVEVAHAVLPGGGALVAGDDRRLELAHDREDLGHVRVPRAQERLEAVDGRQRERIRDPRREAAADVLAAGHRHEQPGAVLEVEVDELARDAGGTGDLRDRDPGAALADAPQAASRMRARVVDGSGRPSSPRS